VRQRQGKSDKARAASGAQAQPGFVLQWRVRDSQVERKGRSATPGVETEHYDTIRDMIVASSHVLFFLQRRYPMGI
jgi:hypothetical protein